MRPTFRQLQYFVAVANQSAFGAAAQELAVSQPSLSKQLATMEAELGIALFERTSRRVQLTPMGEILLPRARAILRDLEEFRSLARNADGKLNLRLNIGVLPSVGAYYMPLATRRLHASFPDLRLAVQEGATRDLLNHLREGRLDAVIGSPTESPEFHTRPLFTETLWICAAADDPLSSSDGPVTLADLAAKPLLSLSPGYRLAEIVERLAALAGTQVSRDYQGASLDAVRQMAVMGAGVAVLPSLYALGEAIRDPDFILRRLDHPEARHEIALHWRRTSPMNSAFEKLTIALVAVKEEIRAARGEQFP